MYSYNDGLMSAGRRPRLYLAKAGQVVKFAGENIPGYCAVATAQYEKNGKWSSTTYQLELPAGVRPLAFASPMHGTWGDDLASWGQVCENLGLPVETAQALVRAEYPSTAARLDALEAFAASSEAEVETVVISFGSPTNRAIREGYWDSPKSALTSDGRTVTVRPGPMPRSEAEERTARWAAACGYATDGPEAARSIEELVARVSWDYPAVVEPEGAKVLSARHSPGMHGGHWAIEVALAAGD